MKSTANKTLANRIDEMFDGAVPTRDEYEAKRTAQLILADALDFVHFAVSKTETHHTIMLETFDGYICVDVTDERVKLASVNIKTKSQDNTLEAVVEKSELAALGNALRTTPSKKLELTALAKRIGERAAHYSPKTASVATQQTSRVQVATRDAAMSSAVRDNLSDAVNYSRSNWGGYYQQRAVKVDAIREAHQAQRQNSVTIRVDKKIHDGFFTVEFSDMREHRTLRVKTVKEGALAGKRMLGYLSASQNDDDSSYTFFAFVDDARVCFFKKFVASHTEAVVENLVDAVNVLFDDVKAAGMGYAQESSRCCRCNRMLTVTSSIHAGMGPVCAEKGGF
jgi:hypothetical protein